MALTLFGTSGCHLCDEAQEMLLTLGVEHTLIDIVDLPEGLILFGTRIPVVGALNGPQLDWPFSLLDLIVFCGLTNTE